MNSEHKDIATALRHVSVALKHNPKYPFALIIKAGLMAYSDPTEKCLNEAAILCERGFELTNQAATTAHPHSDCYLIAGSIDMLRGKSIAARRYFEDGLEVMQKNAKLKMAIDRMNGVVQVEGREKK